MNNIKVNKSLPTEMDQKVLFAIDLESEYSTNPKRQKPVR